MYKVVELFTDLQDNGYLYRVGDTFPHSGMTVDEKRLRELSGKDNRRGKPLIEQVGSSGSEAKETGELPFERVTYTKSDINRMSAANLRLLASEEGIDNANDLSGSELKKLLIAHFDL